MFQLQHSATFEQIVKKSRFHALALPVASEGDAKAAIAAHARADANHNCWAWRIGQAYRFSDDGEPSGTAGKPILAAIDGQNLDQILVLVARWFGGILLGSGGLVRAYGGTAAACLKGAALVEIKPSIDAVIQLPFADLARVKARLAAQSDVAILEERFEPTGAKLALRIPTTDFDRLSLMVGDLTGGRVILSATD